MARNASYATALLPVALAVTACIAGGRQQANPPAKAPPQPDKILLDRATADIQHKRFEQARLTLQTLINTYETSEFLAKARLAIAESWFKEGGQRGFEQAKAECQQVALAYPNSEAASAAQELLRKIQKALGEKPSPPAR
jgi:outer membrane protein assembly factor BamD